MNDFPAWPVSPSGVVSPVVTDPLTFAGAVTFDKDISVPLTGTDTTTPRRVKFSEYTIGGAWRIGTTYIGGTTEIQGIQGGYDKRLQIYDYGTLELIGGRETTSALPYVGHGTPDIGVLIPNGQAANKGLVVKGAAAQSANLLELLSSADASLARFTSAGRLELPNATSSGAGLMIGTASMWDSGVAGIIQVSSGLWATASLAAKIGTAVQVIVGDIDGLASIAFGSASDWALQRTGNDEATVKAGDTLRLGNGSFFHWGNAANEQATVGAAGAAAALPATPTKFLKVKDSAGTTLVIPAYAAA